MDKFVQLPFVIPAPSRAELVQYAESLLSQGSHTAVIDMDARDRVVRALEQIGGDSSTPEAVVEKVGDRKAHEH